MLFGLLAFGVLAQSHELERRFLWLPPVPNIRFLRDYTGTLFLALKHSGHILT